MIYKWLPFDQAPQTGEIILAEHKVLKAPITIYYDKNAKDSYIWRSVLGIRTFETFVFSVFMYILPKDATTSSDTKKTSINNIKNET